MCAVLTAFANSPDRGRGLARDFRVRWALEELGQTCDVRLLDFADLKTPAHRALHPFGQIPTWQEDGLDLFESGAIVLHIAERHPGLLPEYRADRARAIAWVFAALDTVEPPIWDWDLARMVEGHKPWHAERQPVLEARIHQRLGELSVCLGNRHWLEGRFTLGDLMMVAVLRRLHGSGILEDHPSLAEYVARGEARPAFQRALAAQKADFDASAAASAGTDQRHDGGSA
jgi:glutathione S-transferase